MLGQTSLLISRCTVTSKKFKCYWCFIHCMHTLKSEIAVKSYTLGPVVLKMSCFFSEVPVSVRVNVIFKGGLSQKGDQGMQHKSVSVETLSWEPLWWVYKTPVLNLAESRVSGGGDLAQSSGLCLTSTAWWIFMCRRLDFYCREWELFFLPWAVELRAHLQG